MSIDFNRNDFLKFFSEEDIVEECDELIWYSFSTDELSFSLFIIGYENCVKISSIKYQDYYPIFDVSIKNIAKITCSQTSLFFYKRTKSEIDLNKPDYTVVVKPKVLIDWEIDNFCNPLD